MAGWFSIGAGIRAASVLASAVAVSVAGYFGWQMTQPDATEATVEVAAAPEAVTAANEENTAAQNADTTSAPTAETAAAATEAAQAASAGFDVVRVEPDGSATVAGSATPGASVSLRVDGVEVASATADAQGKFAALFTLSASETPRLMSMVAIDTAGEEVDAHETVALAPILAPVLAPVTAGAAAETDVSPPVISDATPPAEAVLPAVTETAPLAATETEPSAAPVPLATTETAPSAAVVPPAALLLSEDGAEVLQPGAELSLESQTNVSIETIAYTTEGAVQLSGHGQPASFLRLYLDAVAISTVQIGADGAWSVTLSDVAPGIYTLRADQLDAAGTVLSRFETPFKRETTAALEAASAGVSGTAPASVAVETPATAATAVPQTQIAEPVVPTEPVAETSVADDTMIAPLEAPADPALTAAAPAPAAVDPALAPAELATQTSAVQADVVTAAPEAPAAPQPTPEPIPATPAAKPAQTSLSVTVQPGFTLWRIAKEQFGDGVMYVQVFEANKDKIRNPDLIYPGQVFTIPGSE